MASKSSRPVKCNGDADAIHANALVRKHLEYLASDTLHPNPRNVRTHSKKQIDQIAASIQKFGFNNPILIDDQNEVIAGHERLQAARQLGLAEVPVVRLNHLNVRLRRRPRSLWHCDVIPVVHGDRRGQDRRRGSGTALADAA